MGFLLSSYEFPVFLCGAFLLFLLRLILPALAVFFLPTTGFLLHPVFFVGVAHVAFLLTRAPFPKAHTRIRGV